MAPCTSVQHVFAAAAAAMLPPTHVLRSSRASDQVLGPLLPTSTFVYDHRKLRAVRIHVNIGGCELPAAGTAFLYRNMLRWPWVKWACAGPRSTK